MRRWWLLQLLLVIVVGLRTPAGEQRQTVHELLTMDDEDTAVLELFRRGSDVVPMLAGLVGTHPMRARAGRALAYVGHPEGLRALLDAIRVERDQELKVELSVYLAGSLVQTNGGVYTAFLEQCMRTYRHPDMEGPAATAALALGSMRTQESLRILRIAKPLDEQNLPEHEIGKAQRWIADGRVVPGRLARERADAPEDRVKELVQANAFYAEGEEASLAISGVTWSARRDRALVEVTIGADRRSAREYHVTVERVPGGSDRFRISGIWLNMVA